jgi:hypothetical protein
MEFVGLSGFWGVDYPAVATISGYSSCEVGTCVLYTLSQGYLLATQYLQLSAEAEDMEIHFWASTREVKMVVVCRSLTLERTVTIEGTLDDPDPIAPVEPPSGGGFNHWYEDLSLAEKIGLIIGIIGSALLACIILVLADVFLPGLIASWWGYKAISENWSTNEAEMDVLASGDDMKWNYETKSWVKA